MWQSEESEYGSNMLKLLNTKNGWRFLESMSDPNDQIWRSIIFWFEAHIYLILFD